MMPDKTNKTSLAIIGAGPGGYTAALLAARAGIDVTLIDQKMNPGGVCLYSGCIPSKTLLHLTRILNEAKESEACGITFGEPQIDIDKVRQWKNEVIAKLTQGIGLLCKQSRVKFVQAKAVFQDETTLELQLPDGSKESLSFEKAIIATGSTSTRLPFAPPSGRILDSMKAVNIKDIPPSLLVIGGGYIGLELGTVYASFGCQVTVVETLPQLLIHTDRDLVRLLEREIKRNFHSIMLQTKVVALEEKDDGMHVTFEDIKGQRKEQTFDTVLVSIGRKPFSNQLQLEKANIKVDGKGYIPVNESFQTNRPHVYAVGDVIGNPMLAHKAFYEARQVVDILQGKHPDRKPPVIPSVVFTDPEIAWCGLTEQEAQKNNINVKISKFSWQASGRAITINRPSGLTKLIFDPETDKLLGMGIVGYDAGELIGQGTLALQTGATAEDLIKTLQQHPTLSETIMEAAQNMLGISAHIMPT